MMSRQSTIKSCEGYRVCFLSGFIEIKSFMSKYTVEAQRKLLLTGVNYVRHGLNPNKNDVFPDISTDES